MLFIARLLDSVAPDVKIISLGSALSNSATCILYFSTISLVSLPKEWLLECGLANFSEKKGNIFLRTLSLTGVEL